MALVHIVVKYEYPLVTKSCREGVMILSENFQIHK
jgi:hypothetical protein